MNTALIKLLEQNLPNVPYLVLNRQVLEELLDPAEHYPTRILDAAVNVILNHEFGTTVYGHIFGDDLLVSTNPEEFAQQSRRMLGVQR